MVGKKFKDYKKNQVPLTSEERAEVKRLKATWSNGDSAVWKSVDKKTGETTYITHTHRAFNTAPTLKGAAGRFHGFIKSTAGEVDNSMEKVAIYKAHIEKIASRAWKRNFHNLSEEGIEALKKSNILNHAKEMEGLNKGSMNILKEQGYDVVNSSREMGHRAKKYTEQQLGDDIVGKIISNYTGIKVKRRIKKSGPTTNMGLKSIYMPKTDKWAKGLKTKVEKDYVDAISLRHEADEARYFAKNKDKKYETNNVLPNSNHVNPNVLLHESTHTAIAPDSVKKLHKDIREYTGEANNIVDGKRVKTPMSPRMSLDSFGVNYGEKAIYDKKLGNRIEKDTGKWNEAKKKTGKGLNPNELEQSYGVNPNNIVRGDYTPMQKDYLKKKRRKQFIAKNSDAALVASGVGIHKAVQHAKKVKAAKEVARKKDIIKKSIIGAGAGAGAIGTTSYINRKKEGDE